MYCSFRASGLLDARMENKTGNLTLTLNINFDNIIFIFCINFAYLLIYSLRKLMWLNSFMSMFLSYAIIDNSF